MTSLDEQLERDADDLARATVEALEDRGVFERYGADGRTKCQQDTLFHLEYLRAALDANDREEFRQYRAWLLDLLGARGIPEEDVDANFDALSEVISARYGEAAAPAVALLREGS